MKAGRPVGSKGANADQRRSALVHAAATVFAARGYDGASTRLLAQNAGVTIGTLAYHFGDKQGLYHAVLDDLYGQLLAIPISVDATLNPEQRVRSVVTQLYRFVVDKRVVVRILLRHVLEHGRLPEEVISKWLEATLRKVAELEQSLDIGSFQDKRLALLSLNHLMARYAVTEPEEWKPLLPGQRTNDAVEQHLGFVATKLLL